MFVKTLIQLATLFVLAGCLPETQISAKNTETILTATSVAHHVNDTVRVGISSQASLANNLSRMSARKASNFYVEDSCSNSGEYQFTGDYADSDLGVAGNFNLAFNQCDNASGEVAGVVEGSFTALLNKSELLTDYNVEGDFDITLGRDVVKVTDFIADVDLEVGYVDEAETNYIIHYHHAGVYRYDTSYYQGMITAKTITQVEWRYIAQKLTAVQGEVTYTDDADNVLKVMHDANGVSTYLNDVLVKTYNHEQWLQKF